MCRVLGFFSKREKKKREREIKKRREHEIGYYRFELQQEPYAMTKRCKRRRRGGGETSRHTHTGSALYRCLPSCSIVHVVLIFLFFLFNSRHLFLPFFFCSHLPNLLFSYDIFAL